MRNSIQREVERFLSPAFRTIQWKGDHLVLLDQRRLPKDEVYLELRTPEEVASAIRDLVVRGAPAIGVTAAMGMALAARSARTRGTKEFLESLDKHYHLLMRSRPTAVNLRWALERQRRRIEALAGSDPDEIQAALEEEALRIFEEDVLTNVAIGEHGAQVVPSDACILTHCNAGALATAGYGTALGVVRSAYRQGKVQMVFADETRPFLQGSRLTAWELQKDGIPVTVITDNMAGHFLQRGEITLIIVGADRIAQNGDVANKIGTYSLAVLAKENQVPFYVAAPLSTFDGTLESGDRIPIEERNGEEVLLWEDMRLAPAGVTARYPAFDITPNQLITGIITEKGVIRPPLKERIRKLLVEE